MIDRLAAIADGRVRKLELIRTVGVGGPLRAVSEEAIRSALETDPLTRYYLDNNILLAEDVVSA